MYTSFNKHACLAKCLLRCSHNIFFQYGPYLVVSFSRYYHFFLWPSCGPKQPRLEKIWISQFLMLEIDHCHRRQVLTHAKILTYIYTLHMPLTSHLCTVNIVYTNMQAPIEQRSSSTTGCIFNMLGFEAVLTEGCFWSIFMVLYIEWSARIPLCPYYLCLTFSLPKRGFTGV